MQHSFEAVIILAQVHKVCIYLFGRRQRPCLLIDLSVKVVGCFGRGGVFFYTKMWLINNIFIYYMVVYELKFLVMKSVTS